MSGPQHWNTDVPLCQGRTWHPLCAGIADDIRRFWSADETLASNVVTESIPMTQHPTKLADFAGDWNIDRRIEDRLAKRTAQLKGTALFAWSGTDLIYSEAGMLTLDDGPALSTQQEYLWQTDGSEVRVYFANRAPFHRFPLSVPIANASYWCDPDQYDVRYEFRNWPVWTVTWTVHGPRKDYISITRFERELGRGNEHRKHPQSQIWSAGA